MRTLSAVLQEDQEFRDVRATRPSVTVQSNKTLPGKAYIDAKSRFQAKRTLVVLLIAIQSRKDELVMQIDKHQEKLRTDILTAYVRWRTAPATSTSWQTECGKGYSRGQHGVYDVGESWKRWGAMWA